MEYNNFNINLDIFNDEQIQKEREIIAEQIRRRRMRREHERKKRQKRRIMVSIFSIGILTLLLVGVLLIKSNLGSSKSTPYTEINGEWAIDDVTKYIFNSDGTGTMQLPSESYLFSYKIDNNKIIIDFESDSVNDSNYSYTIKNKVLTIISDKHPDVKYTMTKQ